MSKIAVIRHGQYGFDDRLNGAGRKQMQWIGAELQRFLTGDEIALILSSTALRALDSAKILARILNARIETHEVLYSETGRLYDCQAVHRLVQSIRNRTNLAIVVTHYEYANNLPAYLGKSDLDKNFSPPPIDKGSGVLIDYKAKSLQILANITLPAPSR